MSCVTAIKPGKFTSNEKLPWSKPHRSIKRLVRLAHDEDPRIRAAAANHPDTPESCLIELARDGYYVVRSAVARNTAATPAVLEILAEDQDPRISTYVRSFR